MSIALTGAVPQITLAHRLRIAREFAGLDQSELADRAEIGRTTVVNYELGYRTPRRLYLRAIWLVADRLSAPPPMRRSGQS